MFDVDRICMVVTFHDSDRMISLIHDCNRMVVRFHIAHYLDLSIS